MEFQSEPQSPTTPLNPATAAAAAATKELPQDVVRVTNPMGGLCDVRIVDDDTVDSLYEKVAAQMYGSSAMTGRFILVAPNGQPLEQSSSPSSSASSSPSPSSSQTLLRSIGICPGASLRLMPRLSSGIGAPTQHQQQQHQQQIAMSELQAMFGSSLNDLLLAAAQGQPANVKVNIGGQELQLKIQPQFHNGSNEVEIAVSLDADGGSSSSSSSSSSNINSAPSSPTSASAPTTRAAKRSSSSSDVSHSSKRDASSSSSLSSSSSTMPMPLPSGFPLLPLLPSFDEETMQQALTTPEVRRLLQEQCDRMREMAKEQKVKDNERDKLKNKLDSVKTMLRSKKQQKAAGKAAKAAKAGGAGGAGGVSSSSSSSSSTASSAKTAAANTAAAKKKQEVRGYMGLKKGFLL